MDFFSPYLVDPDNDDWMIHFVYITRDAKRLVADQLLRVMREVEEDLMGDGVLDDDRKYRAWLAVIHGDLDKREGRDFNFLDGPQIRQVYDYLTLVLRIPLPPFSYDSRASNEHLWKFFSAVHSGKYRFTVYGEPDVEMQNKRVEYEALRARLRDCILQDPHREWVEDLFYRRGLWIANNDLQQLQKAHVIAEKFYNLERGQDRFDKLFSYHGKREDLMRVYHEWRALAQFYVRPWIDDCRKQSVSKTAMESVRSKCRAVLTNADELIQKFEKMDSIPFSFFVPRISTHTYLVA